MGPETDPERLASHAVVDPGERLRLIESLRSDREMVTLHAADDADCFVVSRVVAIDRDRGTVDFEFNTDEARETAFRRVDRLLCVALPDGVKLQFELEHFAIVDLPDHARLRARLPDRAWRIQRREAYRVAAPPLGPARLRLTHGATSREVILLDLSATGLAYVCAAHEAPPVDARLSGTWLELPGCAPIGCVLRVRDVAPVPDEVPAMLRVGCGLEGLDPPAMRAVQVYVNTAQTRTRRSRPRLG